MAAPIIIEFGGSRNSIRGWSKITGIPSTTILHRFKTGLDAAQILHEGKLNINPDYKYVSIRTNDNGKPRHMQLHRHVMENHIGRRLNRLEIVHHKDGDPTNNRLENLVLCRDAREHFLLHRKMDALRFGGNENHRKCKFCKQYDSVENLYVSKNGRDVHHSSCLSNYRKEKSNVGK